jgi:hypothetical protein
MECPDCKGLGKLLGLFPVYAEHVPQEERKPAIEFKCDLCRGIGAVPHYMARRILKGHQLRDVRLEKQIGLRECAERLGVQPSYLSDAQRGKLPIGRIKELRRDVLKLDTGAGSAGGAT